MTPPTTRIAVIGGGPSAMFFCHSLEQQTREARKQKRIGNCSNLLQVTCFEKSSTPGGVWKAAPVESIPFSDNTSSGSVSASESESANKPVYEELWTNGTAHCMEFYDYTFDEHLDGEPAPLFLPRHDVNDYLINRVTKNCPTFFQDYFKFCTEVVHVRWLQETFLFEVTVRNTQTGVTSVMPFEKCIWAAGMNGRCSIPFSLRQKFEKASPITPMNLLHSGETDRIRNIVPTKRVLLVGGGLSAEDLALQCLKWGADHIHVVARAEDPEVSWISRWPFDRVTVHSRMAVKSVSQDGSIELQQMEEVWPFDYLSVHTSDDDSSDDEDDTHECILTDIETVIFCTGYEPNLSMLDPSLKPESGVLPYYNMGKHPTMFLHSSDEEFEWSKWKMNADNEAHQITGDIPLAQGRMIRGFDNHPDIYRGIFLTNPSMMYLSEDSYETPLIALDVKAWLLCSYLSGRIPVPSVEQLRQASKEQLLEQLHLPAVRICLDEEYCRTLKKKASDQFWDEKWDMEEVKSTKYAICLLSRIMEEGQYPGLLLATNMELNNHGKKFFTLIMSDYYARANISRIMEETGDFGRTFRDDFEETLQVFSLYTGKVARPLKKRWMDIVGPNSIKNGDI